MLKKIVKYGNSCALVLDKALIELLNMEEGSVVKIKTDGVSLIITPQKALMQETISPTITTEATLKDAIRAVLGQSFGDPKRADAFQTSLKEMSHYTAIIRDKMNTSVVRQAIADVQKHFPNDEANPEFAKRIKKIHQQYIPEIEDMNRELDALIKKYPAANSPDYDGVNISQMREDFQTVHEKYRHVMQAVVTLNENSDYIHEMILIAEKYQVDKNPTNSAEYLAAYTKLVSKYVPEYAAYQEELKKVGAGFENKGEMKAVPQKTSRKKNN